MVDLPAFGVHVQFNGRPINRMTRNLYNLLIDFVVEHPRPGGLTSPQRAAALRAQVKFTIYDATDTAGDGEMAGVIYTSQSGFHAEGQSGVAARQPHRLDRDAARGLLELGGPRSCR